MTEKLRAEIVSDKVIRIYRGTLQVGGLSQTRFDGTWESYVNCTGTSHSRAPFKTAAAAAKARWGAAGRDAVIDALIVKEKAEANAR